MNQHLHREMKVWHSVSHKNLVPFLGLCYGIGPFPAIITPLYDNGDLFRYLSENPGADQLTIVRPRCLWRRLH
jgi:serine/threonine protein kinase